MTRKELPFPVEERETIMSDAINNQSRLSQSNASMRSAIEKTDKKQGPQTPLVAEDSAPAKAKASGADTLSLSNVTDRVKEQPSFNRAKVEAIKQALADGNYPLNPRRIAESFVSLEKMVQG
ncbi:FlgM_jcvi, flagellar biosynthesis anti-sigma factor FlgM [Burkholderiaceae bacterium]|jgi:negative regulator of flagellin synthesis FlgM